MPSNRPCRQPPPQRLITPKLIERVESLLRSGLSTESVAEQTWLPVSIIQVVTERMRQDKILTTKKDTHHTTLESLTPHAPEIQWQCRLHGPRPIIRHLATKYPELTRRDLAALTGVTWWTANAVLGSSGDFTNQWGP